MKDSLNAHVLERSPLIDVSANDALKYRNNSVNNNPAYVKRKWRAVKLNCDFWNRKEVKCKMKIKKTNPTPKSMTQRNPI